MGLEELQGRKLSYADYVAWSGVERFELIDGAPYDMTPAPGTAHQRVVGELYRQLSSAMMDAPCEAFVAPLDVRFAEADESLDQASSVVQPDVLVLCDPDKLDAEGVRGAPDVVIEVLSPSTAAKDQILKRQLYERHGVLEFWTVHPVDRILVIYRLGSDGRYAPPEIVAGEGRLQLSAIEGLEVDLDLVFRS